MPALTNGSSSAISTFIIVLSPFGQKAVYLFMLREADRHGCKRVAVTVIL